MYRTFVLLYLAGFNVFFSDIRHVNTSSNQLDKVYKQLNNVDTRNIRYSIRGIWRTTTQVNIHQSLLCG